MPMKSLRIHFCVWCCQAPLSPRCQVPKVLGKKSLWICKKSTNGCDLSVCFSHCLRRARAYASIGVTQQDFIPVGILGWNNISCCFPPGLDFFKWSSCVRGMANNNDGTKEWSRQAHNCPSRRCLNDRNVIFVECNWLCPSGCLKRAMWDGFGQSQQGAPMASGRGRAINDDVVVVMLLSFIPDPGLL